uniref:Reverse transcriptase zinc-binding domain-containing protein n=1 Tax=Tanacetum cinerariifolium TaxID=118510 RepID=A0A699KVL0_TANCI|nr:hypothetical protein [Tanacetum cinerariifolium]
MKERIKSLSGKLKAENIKRELEEIETINIELDHRVTKLVTEKEHLKQTYKKLYDSIKSLQKIKRELEEIETINIELDHRVTKLVTEKEHLKQTYKKLYDSIKSLRVNLLTSASGLQPQGNTKKDRIQQIQSRAKKNKLEDHPKNVRPSLHNKKSVVNTKAISSVPNSKLNVISDLKCAMCNGCLFYDNHDSCVLEFINSVNVRVKSKSSKKPVNRKIWKPTWKMFTTIGLKWRSTCRTFTLVENVCPLTRITTTAIVPLRKPIPLESNISKPVVTLVYLRKLKEARNTVPVSNSKINKSLVAKKGT